MSDPDRQYRDLADLNPDAFIIQVEGRVVYCNQSARRMFRDGEAARLIGRDAIQLVDPDFRDFVLKRRKTVLSTGEQAPYSETRHLRLDGTSFPSEMVVGPVTWDGRGGTMNIIHDITVRKEAEEALRESEARLSKAAELAKIGYWVWDKVEGKAIYCSEELAKIYGVASGAELVAVCSSHAADLEWVHPEDRERFDESLRTAKKTKRGFDFEYRIIKLSGEVRHVHNIEEPVLDERGEIIRSNGTTQDITERKRAEEALRESERRYRDLFDHAVVGIYRTTPDGRHLEVNPALARMRGCDTSAEFMAHFVDARHPIYVDPAAREKMSRLMREQGYVIGFESESYRRDSTRFWMSETGRAVRDETGRLIAYEGFIEDITERKRAEEELRQSEERFRAFLDGSPDAVFLKDTDGRFLLCNKEFERWTGYSSEQLRGRMDLDVFPRLFEEHPQIREHERRVKETGCAIREGRELLEPDGSVRYFSITKFPVFDSDGKVTGIGTANQDITDLKRAEEQLRQAQKMEAVGQLTGGVAHDFNNLLAVMLGNAEVLEGRLGHDDKKLQAIIRAATRGAELTQHLLSFSRRQSLRPQGIDLDALVTEMSNLLHLTLGETIEIEIILAPALWRAQADPSQLENAILNLAINARNAMPGGGKLTIESTNAPLDESDTAGHMEITPGDYVMLSVSDTGTGMTPEVLAHAFEPFFTTKEVGEGTGLGLSMVYGFVKQSGGEVVIDSEEGQGTTVRLYLPRAKAATDKSERDTSTKEPSGHGETILVVEDDPDVRELAEVVLVDLRYRVLTAQDGRTGLAALEKAPGVDLLLSDVVLPGGMSGPDLAEQVRRHSPDLKVLFMSGYAVTAAQHHSPLPKNAAVLKKPFRKNELAQKVRAMLDR